MKKKDKKALVTGGAGFIGSHLSEKLLSDGWKVSIIDDLSTGSLDNLKNCLHHPNFSFVIDTILNETVLDGLVSECDVVFHLASAVGVKLIINDPVRVITTNVAGTEMALKVASKYKKKILITSTSEVYGKSKKVPFREDDDILIGPTTKQRWIYACSKAIDEFAAFAYYKRFGLPIIIVRLFNTIGTRQTGKYGMVVPRFITQALLGKPVTVYGSGEQTRCFADVREIVNFLILLIQNDKAVGEVFNLGSNKEISINELAKLVVKSTKSKSKIVHIPYEEAYGSGFEDMLRRIPDITKARRLIGFLPKIKLADTIKEIIKEKARKDY